MKDINALNRQYERLMEGIQNMKDGQRSCCETAAMEERSRIIKIIMDQTYWTIECRNHFIRAIKEEDRASARVKKMMEAVKPPF